MHAVNDKATSTEYVVMTKSEALALSGALDRARQRLVREIARAGRSRIPSPEKVEAVRALHADLSVLRAFHEAHEEAHGLGGN